jgi:DNA-binding MarR family transcriptional regulator
MSSQTDFLNVMESWASIYLFHSLTEFFNYLKLSDISMLQAYALTFIFYKGSCNISDLCEHMMVSVAAASQMVDRLEKQNLVDRTAQPGDRRVRNVVLSDQGNIFVKQSIEARQSWVKEIPAKVSEEQLDQISSALQLLTSIYQE